MRASRGFTMLEMLTVVAIIGVIAAIAIPTLRAASRNASVSSVAFEMGLKLGGLRGRALADQRADLLAVIVDVPGNDATACAHGADAQCSRYFLLRPGAGFVLNGFDPDSPPFANATYVDDTQLPRGVRFHRRANGLAAPAPFDGITAFDPALVGACGSRACVAIRFRGDGTVLPELPGGGTDPAKVGLAFGLGSELSDQTKGADQRGILVSFPTGIVKTYPLPP